MKNMNTEAFDESEFELLKSLFTQQYKGKIISIGIQNKFQEDKLFYVHGKCIGVLGSRVCLLNGERTFFYEITDIKRIAPYIPEQPEE